VHLNLAGGDEIEGLVDMAVNQGARVSEFQPDPRWRVMLDPAGHKFCITTVTPPGQGSSG
jgi:hypothetical protein